MKLHVLTACTRTENLPVIASSLEVAEIAGIAVHWHIGFDMARRHPGGQGVKNRLLDGITDGWVWICDDDNTAAPGFFPAIAAQAISSDVRLIACAQQTAGGVRPVHRAMLRPTLVDTAQVVVRRDAIGDLRIPEHYCGDGEWIQAIAARTPETHTVYLNRPVVVSYNSLRGGVA